MMERVNPMEHEYKKVRFDKYCEKCKYKDEDVTYGSTCDTCLSEPINLHSEKPVKWEEQ